MIFANAARNCLRNHSDPATDPHPVTHPSTLTFSFLQLNSVDHVNILQAPPITSARPGLARLVSTNAGRRLCFILLGTACQYYGHVPRAILLLPPHPPRSAPFNKCCSLHETLLMQINFTAIRTVKPSSVPGRCSAE